MLVGVSLAEAATRRVQIGDGMAVTLNSHHEVILEALPLRHEGLIAFANRLCGRTRGAVKKVSAANRGVRRLRAGVRYRVPFELLLPEYQLRALTALFEADSLQAEGWLHVVGKPEGRRSESLWQIAEWFTGSGLSYKKIRTVNRLTDEEILPGQRLLIPRDLLRPTLASALPRSPAPGGPVAPGRLEYGADEHGSYALYSLRAGEALYSSVVVHFTGRIYVDDVNRIAGEIAARNRILDVTDIPVGYKVKIPLEYLMPEFLPAADPRRLEYEEGLSRSAEYSNQVRSHDLAGVTVVLDAGHGGRDVGASVGRVWESIYVYDIMLRTRRLLLSTTAAEVVPTTRDGSSYAIQESDVLSPSRGHAVLTSPPYAIEDASVSSNLRWYLSNSVFSGRVSDSSDPDKVVFISIHADSLHPSLRGAMVYFPGLLKNPSSYGKSGTVYTSRREVREQPRVSFTQSERIRSEGRSRDMAARTIQAFRAEGLKVHDNKPVRDRVIRRRKAWVPAVLRFNEVPARVLVEVCNLANPEDRRLIQTQVFREKVARAIVRGIRSYYSSSEQEGSHIVGG